MQPSLISVFVAVVGRKSELVVLVGVGMEQSSTNHGKPSGSATSRAGKSPSAHRTNVKHTPSMGREILKKRLVAQMKQRRQEWTARQRHRLPVDANTIEPPAEVNPSMHTNVFSALKLMELWLREEWKQFQADWQRLAHDGDQSTMVMAPLGEEEEKELKREALAAQGTVTDERGNHQQSMESMDGNEFIASTSIVAEEYEDFEQAELQSAISWYQT